MLMVCPHFTVEKCKPKCSHQEPHEHLTHEFYGCDITCTNAKKEHRDFACVPESTIVVKDERELDR